MPISSSKQIKLGAILSYIAIVINILTGLIYTPWMISSIGRENYGLYVLAQSVITIFVFDFGLSYAVTRYMAKYIAEGNQEKANNCLGLVYKLYLYIDVFFVVVLSSIYFFLPNIYKELTPVELEKFKIIYIMVAFYSVFSFPFIPVGGIIGANELFVQGKLCDIFHKLFIVVAMSVCLLMDGGLYHLVMVNVIAGVLTIFLKLIIVRKYTNQKVNFAYRNKQEFKEIIGYSGWVTVIALAQRCIFNFAPSILGALSGSAEIAILGIALTLEGYTYTFANALNGMFLPKISRIVANGDGDVTPLMIKVGRIQIIVVSFIILGIICFGADFIQLWVGDKFSKSYLCALFIIVPCFIQIPQEIGMTSVYVMNKVKMQAIVFVGMAVINIVGAVALSPLLGSLGICMSVCVAYLVRTFGMDYVFYKYMHIGVFSFFRESFFKMMPVLLLVLIIGLCINFGIKSGGWIMLILKIALFSIIYIGAMWFMCMNDYEKTLFIEPVKRIFFNECESHK